jgi:hypothetical protein
MWVGGITNLHKIPCHENYKIETEKKTCFRQKNTLLNKHYCVVTELDMYNTTKNMKNFFVSFELATSAYSFLPSLAFLCGWTLLRREGKNNLN